MGRLHQNVFLHANLLPALFVMNFILILTVYWVSYAIRVLGHIYSYSCLVNFVFVTFHSIAWALARGTTTLIRRTRQVRIRCLTIIQEPLLCRRT